MLVVDVNLLYLVNCPLACCLRLDTTHVTEEPKNRAEPLELQEQQRRVHVWFLFNLKGSVLVSIIG